MEITPQQLCDSLALVQVIRPAAQLDGPGAASRCVELIYDGAVELQLVRRSDRAIALFTIPVLGPGEPWAIRIEERCWRMIVRDLDGALSYRMRQLPNRWLELARESTLWLSRHGVGRAPRAPLGIENRLAGLANEDLAKFCISAHDVTESSVPYGLEQSAAGDVALDEFDSIIGHLTVRNGSRSTDLDGARLCVIGQNGIGHSRDGAVGFRAAAPVLPCDLSLHAMDAAILNRWLRAIRPLVTPVRPALRLTRLEGDGSIWYRLTTPGAIHALYLRAAPARDIAALIERRRAAPIAFRGRVNRQDLLRVVRLFGWRADEKKLTLRLARDEWREWVLGVSDMSQINERTSHGSIPLPQVEHDADFRSAEFRIVAADLQQALAHFEQAEIELQYRPVARGLSIADSTSHYEVVLQVFELSVPTNPDELAVPAADRR